MAGKGSVEGGSEVPSGNHFRIRAHVHTTLEYGHMGWSGLMSQVVAVTRHG